MTPNQASLELPGALLFSSGFSSFLVSLAPIAAVILLQTTILLLAGFLVACVVSLRRLALLSLIYRSLLVGVLLICIAAIAPTRLPTNSIEPVWSFSMATSSSVAAVDASGAMTPSPKSATSPAGGEEAPSGSSKGSGDEAVSRAATTPASSSSPGSSASIPTIESAWPYSFLTGVWLVVASAKLIWLLLAGLYAARLRQGRAVDHPAALLLVKHLSTRLKVRVPLLVSHSQVQIPFLSGLVRPTIVLPTRYATDFDDAALQAILWHELAHLARRDCWWKHLAGIAGALLWIQPLVWLLRRRLEQTDESLCDQIVLHNGCSPRSYASVLLKLAERLSYAPREQVSGAGIVSFRSTLGQRIQSIMENPRVIRLPLSSTTRLATVAAMTAAVTAVLMLMTVNVTVKAAPQRSDAKSGTASGAARADVARNQAERQIPWDATPEASVGLPASLKDAHGNATITGRVLYENGKPAAGLKVGAYCRWLSQTELWDYKRNQSTHYRFPEKITKLLSGKAVTRADGSYRIAGLLAQLYSVNVQGDRFGNRAPVGLIAPIRGVKVNAVAKQSRKVPDIVLRRSARINIRVVDHASGTPLEGVSWRGFILDETNGKKATARSVDARGEMRPMKIFPSTGITDKNGACTLSLDAGKAYFYMNGGMVMGSIRQDDPGATPPYRSSPETIITSNGLYKAVEWCEVVASKQAPRRAWKGETQVQVKNGQVKSFTVRLKRYGALTPAYRSFLKRH